MMWTLISRAFLWCWWIFGNNVVFKLRYANYGNSIFRNKGSNETSLFITSKYCNDCLSLLHLMIVYSWIVLPYVMEIICGKLWWQMIWWHHRLTAHSRFTFNTVTCLDKFVKTGYRIKCKSLVYCSPKFLKT